MKAPVSDADVAGAGAEATPGTNPARSLSVDGQAIVLAAVVAVAILLGVIPGVPW